MIDRPHLLAAVALVCAGASAVAQSVGDSFAVTDADLARLGVTLGALETVERVEVAAGPAAVVVPSARQALVSAPQGGVVGRLLAAEGDSVAAGQPLAEIESADYLERQRDYLDAAAEADLATTQEARDRDLFDQGIIAERRLAETRAAARAAQSRLEQARAQLELAGLARADIANLAAERRLATRMILRAPFAGTVTAVHAQVGGRVDMLDPVLAVADLQELWLEVRLPQENAARVAAGMSVSVTPPGGDEITGVVTTIGGVVDANTQTVLVRATVANGGRMLRAGQFVTARIHSRPPNGAAFAVPTAAVTRNGADALLFVRSGANVEVRRVAVLGDDGERVYVSSGVGRTDRIAVEGISALKALWLSTADEGG